MRGHQPRGHGVARPLGTPHISCTADDPVRGERVGDEFGDLEVQRAPAEQHHEVDLAQITGRGDGPQCPQRVDDEHPLLGGAAHGPDALQRMPRGYRGHAVVRERDDPCERRCRQRLLEELDGAVLQADVEEALGLAQRVPLDVLGEFQVVQSEFGVDQFGHQIARAREVHGVDGAVGLDQGCVGGSAAEIEHHEWLVGARCGQRAQHRHLGLHATDLDVGAGRAGGTQTVADRVGHRAHTAFLGAHHGRQRDGVLQRDLAGHAAANLLRHKGVDGQQILDAHVGGVVLGQVGHALAHVGDHAAGVGAGFADDVGERGDALDGGHDLDGPAGHVDRGLPPFPAQLKGSRGDGPVGDVACRRAHHDRRPVAGQGAGHRRDHLGGRGVEVEDRGETERVGQRADRLAGPGDLDGREHAERDRVDARNLVDDGDPGVEAVDHQHGVVVAEDRCGHLDTAACGRVDRVRGGLEVDAFRDDDDHPRVEPGTRIGFGQRVERDRGPDAESATAGGARIVPDHRRLGDDGLGDGLHREPADHRGGLVEQDDVEFGGRDPGLGESARHRGRDAVDVLGCALDPGRRGQRRAEEPHRTVRFDRRGAGLGGRVTDVDADNGKCHQVPSASATPNCGTTSTGFACLTTCSVSLRCSSAALACQRGRAIWSLSVGTGSGDSPFAYCAALDPMDR
ncbi:hypothetical protein MSMEI_1512 [Mycolicibacterium smegmatis MC2 155]|uniref:Uncharacterized protein n=2 Tax=Mycolicibacterium smegmatis (strain ATCC 700084 / mc(2)155) TaxID=246196 RepID=I7F8U8_MYCS2|nr:putative transcriptional regulator [Mycolicibacterium smegmatis MC2 155]AFP37985.1 hypothetical protein MSMEI_1512 [Mycolicibacterium smegmatis MC2 155]